MKKNLDVKKAAIIFFVLLFAAYITVFFSFMY